MLLLVTLLQRCPRKPCVGEILRAMVGEHFSCVALYRYLPFFLSHFLPIVRCGHCKRLAPEIEKASEIAPEGFTYGKSPHTLRYATGIEISQPSNSSPMLSNSFLSSPSLFPSHC